MHMNYTKERTLFFGEREREKKKERRREGKKLVMIFEIIRLQLPNDPSVVARE